MKKIISLVLAAVLTFSIVLALSSCGLGTISKYSNDVDASEFYKKLGKALELSDGDMFEENLKVTFKAASKSNTKTKYDGGKTVRENEKTTMENSLKYSEDDGLALYEYSYSSSGKSSDGEYSSTGSQEFVYQQDGDDFITFNNLDKTYEESKDYEYGVQYEVDDTIDSFLHYSIMSDVFIYTFFSASEISDEMLDSYFDEDVDIEYYIDGDKYTVVYIEETEEEKDDCDVTEKTEITVQITVKDNKITAVRNEKTTLTHEYKNYTETYTYEEKISLEISFTNVSVSEPNKKKYVEKE